MLRISRFFSPISVTVPLGSVTTMEVPFVLVHCMMFGLIKKRVFPEPEPPTTSTFLFVKPFFTGSAAGWKKNLICLCQAGPENTSCLINCLMWSSRLMLLFVLKCRITGYVPLPMVRTSEGFSASFGSSTTTLSFMFVNGPLSAPMVHRFDCRNLMLMVEYCWSFCSTNRDLS